MISYGGNIRQFRIERPGDIVVKPVNVLRRMAQQRFPAAGLVEPVLIGASQSAVYDVVLRNREVEVI
ncbi:MAG: hypothetical protein AAF633_03225 [Chloroflexota bacterium]